jgi:phosphatidylcholine synthase
MRLVRSAPLAGGPRTEWAVVRAWVVHGYTALGLVAAAAMAWSIVEGTPTSLRWAIGWMIVATVIDATDGTLARRWRVQELVPGFDGRRLDDIVDFQTYTSLPLFFLWRSGVVPDTAAGWLLVPLLASAYGFCQTRAKTEDHFFLGFPSYWNVLAIYLYWIGPPLWLTIALLLLFSLLTFVPFLYLYPSYDGPFSRSTRLLCAGWAVVLGLLVGEQFADPVPVVWASLSFPVYYLILSWGITLRRWRQRKARERSSGWRAVANGRVLGAPEGSDTE